MARIPYFDPERAPEHVIGALAGKSKLNIFRMIANSDNCGAEVLALGHKLSKGSSLDPVHREIVILRVAHLTESAYLRHEHTAIATRVGLTRSKIESVACYPEQDADEFSTFERLLLEFTDTVVKTATASDDLFDAVAAEYDESKLVELVLLIGFYMMVARVMNTFEVDLETGPVEPYRLRLT